MPVAPHRPKGPALNAMRAFEAAARHESFVLAAEELGVTPGAVSQHIRTLEGWTGRDLFRRTAQGVMLTAEGRDLVGTFTDAFDALAVATQALRNLQPGADIHIAALPSIAQLWLPGRLSRLRRDNPDLSFSVTALETPPSLTRDLFDLAIFMGSPDVTEIGEQVDLGPDRIVPVCAPALLAGRSRAEVLATGPFLHDQTWQADWPHWAKEADVPLADPHRGPRYSLYSLAVEEAKAGAGVLMAHLHLVDEALQSGALVPLSDRIVPTGRSLMVSLPPKRSRRAGLDGVVAQLRD